MRKFILTMQIFFDDIWMFVHPVLLGQGERLFEDAQSKISLKLDHSKQYQNEVVGLYYKKSDG